MATRADFSASEWQVLRNAPHLVVVAVAAAGGSGLFGSLKEAVAPAGGIMEVLKGRNGLLRDLCSRDEVTAAIEALKEQAKAADFPTMQDRFRQDAIAKSRAALEILRDQGSLEDVEAYGGFLMNLGERVANAAKEGAFLGFGGERVSENERILLTELAEVVAAQQA